MPRSIFTANKLGLKETRRRVDEKNRYTLVFLAGAGRCAGRDRSKKKAGAASAPEVELTYNWDSEDYGEARYFGHLAYEVDDIYATCDRLMKAGVTINRPPRDGVMAFVRSPDKHSIELLQKGAAMPPQEPWKSMPNTGKVVIPDSACRWRRSSLYVARNLRPSSRGLGHRPFTAVTGVRIP